jgi:hypothetical protein
MYPAPTDTDFQVAMIRNRQLEAEGQRQQFLTREFSVPAGSHSVAAALRQQLCRVLLRAGMYLRHVKAVTRKGLRAAPVPKPGSIA